MAVVTKSNFRSLMSQATARTSPIPPLASSHLLSPSRAFQKRSRMILLIQAIRLSSLLFCLCSVQLFFPSFLQLLFCLCSVQLSFPSFPQAGLVDEHAVNWRKLLLLLLLLLASGLLPLRHFLFQFTQNHENSAGKQEDDVAIRRENTRRSTILPTVTRARCKDKHYPSIPLLKLGGLATQRN
jgi:hypothetical protein